VKGEHYLVSSSFAAESSANWTGRTGLGPTNRARVQFPRKGDFRLPFTIPTSIITTFTIHPESDIFTTVPEDDRQAASMIETLLRRFSIEIQPMPCTSPYAPQKPAEHEMILVGGPARNTLSHMINEQLGSVSWFQGFYFSPIPSLASETEHRPRWTIRHRADPDISISEETIIFASGGKDRAYRSFAQEVSHDYGLVFAGANPYNPAYWLLMTAGLGPVGTYAAAHALTSPYVVPLLAESLLARDVYCSILVRYQFEPHERYAGDLTSIIAISGPVTPASKARAQQAHPGKSTLGIKAKG
jgi:hypothetical protein